MTGSGFVPCLLTVCLVAFTAPSLADSQEGEVVNIFINSAKEQPKQSIESSSALEDAWLNFKSEFGRGYTSSEEEYRRKEIFSDNLKFIEKHNFLESIGLRSFKLGVNQFADLELDEFVEQMTGYKEDENNATSDLPIVTYMPPNVPFTIPEAVDWRQKGYVTPVKDQGRCGSCWAFSATGTLEGQMFRKTGRLVSLSEQNLMDCSTKYGNNGCQGGLMDKALKYIKYNGGIDTEVSYPYEGKDGRPCRYKASTRGGTVSAIMVVTPLESKLQEAVASEGPLSVGIDAGRRSFQLYKSGVYDEPTCTTRMNHGVLVVGYGSFMGKDYWQVKNSWGTRWGNQGYIMMSRNKNNQCGIALRAIYPMP